MANAKPTSKKHMRAIAFEKAPDDLCQKYGEEIGRLLSVLGHPEALVTDESRLSDFPLDDAKMAKIRKMSGQHFGEKALLVHIAETMHKKKQSDKKKNRKNKGETYE